MATISVPYQVLIEDVPPIGPTVRYLVKWPDAFTFFDEILGQPPPPGVVPPLDMTEEPRGQVIATKADIEGRCMIKSPDGGFQSFVDALVTVTYGVFPAQAGA